jgi:uncharacterized RDD family membrane protein YckC
MQGGAGHISIETPEHVVFHYELAGIISRMLAAFLDGALQFLIALLIITGAAVVVGASASDLFQRDLSMASTAVIVLLLFVDIWGYPILFETFMGGRTPGKAALKIRVIREGGYALTPGDVIVRNLLRAVDFLPGFYGLGLIVMCLNPRYKRIGDFVAGTLVIRDAETGSMRAPSPRAARVAGFADAGTVDALRRAGIHQLPQDQVALVESFLERRSTLDVAARRTLARKIAGPISERFQVPIREPERFLQDVLQAWREASKEPS